MADLLQAKRHLTQMTPWSKGVAQVLPLRGARARPALRASPRFTRRKALLLTGMGVLFAVSSGPARAWHAADLSGSLPPLDFTLTRASDGKQVTAADYRGKIILLYFGYTFCPDVCPTTLLNISEVLKRLGPLADDVRVLFVTVDPARDTLDLLRQYTQSFAPQVVGLRGTADHLAALARRYRVAYSVKTAGKNQSYEVTHSTATYAFDRNGAARLLISDLANSKVDLKANTEDLHALIQEKGRPSVWQRLLHMI
jgi:protein SCO1/2